MFTDFIVQPLFNLLVLIYALIPGHNFGLAIILFTVLIRIALWPLLRKQLHHGRALKELQPEIKKIKKATKGDKRKESMLIMELYKEREVSPFSSLGAIIPQIIIFIGLFFGIQKVIKDPHQIVNFAYGPIQDLSWMQTIAHDIGRFDETLFGVIDLTRSALSNDGIYWGALILVALSALMQYLQSKQLMPTSADSKSLRQIMKDAKQGKTADQQDVSEAVGRSSLFLIPGLVFLFSLNFAAALPLYWLTSSATAYFQQRRILNEDVSEAKALLSSPTKDKKDVALKPKNKNRTSGKKKSNAKRRK